MNNLDKQYQELLQDILGNGAIKETRNGGTLSVFGRQIRHKMSEGFPLLTTKKMAWKQIVTELLWFLRGDTNIKYLVDNDCHIWDGDAYKNYLKNFVPPVCPPNLDVQPSFYEPMSKEMFIKSIQEKNSRGDEFAKTWGELGPIYGKQWRRWKSKAWIPLAYLDENNKPTINGSESLNGGMARKIITNYTEIDQIQNLINDLKTNPDSRRLMVSAWNVGELDQMVLPPCHNFWQMYSIEKEGKRYLSMMVNIHSNDVPLGLPFNIASYGLLLEIISRLVNMIPDELIINIGDAHIYLNQIEGIKEQLTREPYPLPKLNINTEFWPTESGECGVGPINAQAVLDGFSRDAFCKCLMEEDIQLANYESHPAIKMPLSN